MYLLAFETSCDDTSVAILRDTEVIALVTKTQIEHDATGWVVPEVAARMHANAIFPCLEEAFTIADIHLADIDAIVCTEKPWLWPSLLTGATVARTFALATHKPLIWVDHIESHIFANLLERSAKDIQFPAVVLTISGWHTEIYKWNSLYSLEILGQTNDDAAWEAYDKVAKMLGLGFPGGAKIAKLAENIRTTTAISENEKHELKKLFPRAYLSQDSLDFSFSGLKSAVKRYIDQNPHESSIDKEKIAFAFEEAVVDVLLKKIFLAAQQYTSTQIVLAWWVSANAYLRERLIQESEKKWYSFLAPKKIIYSQDNAAMIGIRGYYEIMKSKV